MMFTCTRIVSGFVFLSSLVVSCNLEKNTEPPELGSLQEGLRTAAVIAYCSSIVVAAHEGSHLPLNVEIIAGAGLLNVRIDDQFPLPFVNGRGAITIASLWNDDDGIMSVLFTGINPASGKNRISGLYAVPLSHEASGDCIRAVFADQDIIIGNGSDTILDLSSISSLFLNSRLDLLAAEEADDPFVAVRQNVWIVNIWQNGTTGNVYDDVAEVSGGGQMAVVEGETGGVIYHALIKTRMNYLLCRRNPVSGYALSQNFTAGGEPLIDLGNSLLKFHSECDGTVHVEISTGKYFGYTGRNIFLKLN